MHILLLLAHVFGLKSTLCGFIYSRKMIKCISDAFIAICSFLLFRAQCIVLTMNKFKLLQVSNVLSTWCCFKNINAYEMHLFFQNKLHVLLPRFNIHFVVLMSLKPPKSTTIKTTMSCYFDFCAFILCVWWLYSVLL